MKAWLLSIIGIVFLGVIIEIIMPNSKNSSFIRHIFSIFILFVVISPIKSLVSNFTFDNTSITLDTNYLYKVNIEKVEKLETEIVNKLKICGVDNAGVIINSNIFDENLTINSIYIDITNSKNSNHYGIDDIKNEVVKIVNINKEDITVYGYKN